MHYIRLLRAPKVSKHGGRQQLSLLFTITTDLGDSFLYPEEYIDLQIIAHATSSKGESSSWSLSDRGSLAWKPGMRVAKPTIDLPKSVQASMISGSRIQICIRTVDSALSADGVPNILAVPSKKRKINEKPTAARGLVMPAWVPLTQDDDEIEAFSRRLHLGTPSEEDDYIEIEEEIGESIARHIWDAGVVALCTIAGLAAYPEHVSSKHECMQKMHNIIHAKGPLRILELGCGVGILGVGLGAAYPKLHLHAPGDCTILMTDLEEGEARARANIARFEETRRPDDTDQASQSVKMIYENLDWEDGRLGKFGPIVDSQPWDLVMLSDCTYNVDMLPALVETLSSLHANNLKRASEEQDWRTKVFLATKPRHASEKALFDLLAKEGWETLHEQVLPLPVLGAESESVEMYLFSKV